MMCSHESRCNTRSHRYDVAAPSGLTGLPAAPSLPVLNGRKCVAFPASRVVIATSSLETAKCTRQRFANPSSGSPFGSRSVRYCALACSIDWVLSVLSSSVATGSPLTNSTRSIEPLCSRGVVDLPHHPHPDRGIARHRGGVERGGGLELAHREPRRGLLEALAEYGERAASGLQRQVERLHQAVEQLLLRPLLLRGRHRRLDDLGPLLGLGLLEPGVHVVGKQRPGLVVARAGGRVEPPVRGQMSADLVLEGSFMLDRHDRHANVLNR